MLQQTQARRVEPFYGAFVKRFPNFQALAHAPLSRVLKAWRGLGYNRRALALKKLSERVITEFHGHLPRDSKTLANLPGIGPGTAGAVSAFAFREPSVFLETNIRRVFLHFFFQKKNRVHDREILALVQKTMDYANPREWYWALMDYGAMLGAGAGNPNRRSAAYRRQPPFKGSDREIRGKMVAMLLEGGRTSLSSLAKRFPGSRERVFAVVRRLAREGFLSVKGNRVKMVR